MPALPPPPAEGAGRTAISVYSGPAQLGTSYIRLAKRANCFGEGMLSMTVREVRRQFGAIRRPVSSCNGRTGAGGGMLTVQTTVRERG